MDIQPVQAPVGAQPTHSKRRFIITIISVLVLIGVLAALAFSPLGAQFKTSQTLNGVGVAEGNYFAVSPQKFSWMGMKKVTTAPVADYARGYSISGTAVVTPDGSVLVDDGSTKAGLSVSNDGSHIAYGVLTTSGPSGEAIPLLSAWTIRVHILETGETFDVGQGFGPQFFMRDGKEYMLYTSNLGPTVVDLAARTSVTTFVLNEGVIDAVAKVSGDGQYLVMQNPVNGHYTAYQISTVSPSLSLTPSRTITAPLVDVLWKGNALIGITEPVEGSVSISRYQIGTEAEDVLITSFDSAAPYRLISL